MSFLRHREIYQVSEHRFRDGELRGRDRAATPPLTDLMSLRLVIPGGLLSSRARFRFTNRGLLCDNRPANCKTAVAGLRTPT
jgi:hypothetical protein